MDSEQQRDKKLYYGVVGAIAIASTVGISYYGMSRLLIVAIVSFFMLGVLYHKYEIVNEEKKEEVKQNETEVNEGLIHRAKNFIEADGFTGLANLQGWLDINGYQAYQIFKKLEEEGIVEPYDLALNDSVVLAWRHKDAVIKTIDKTSSAKKT